MAVVGKNVFVFDSVQDKTCEVQPFDPTIGTAKRVPIVDAAVAYECPYSHKVTILMIRNALYIPSMSHNLLPPFILREAGIVVNDVPKIHCIDPSVEDHSIYFADEELRIPLQLNGIFSYFHTRIPTNDEVMYCDKLFLTPDSTTWDPYATHFQLNEESMLDYEGNMQPRSKRRKHILDMTPISADIDDYEAVVDSVMGTAFTVNDGESECSKLQSQAQIDALHITRQLNARKETESFSTSMGMSMQSGRPFLSTLDELDKMIGSTTAGKQLGVSPEYLTKIWDIDMKTAKGVISQNTQLLRQNADNDLSRLYSTNDRMLRYKRINSQFFTDTFFAAGCKKTTRGNTCAQMFVSDKGFVAIYPMKSKGDFPDALHMFCKEVGVPVTMVVDPSGEQTSKKVKKFCHQVGTSLRILEESTQWANRAELYIGIFKEAIRKDLHRTNSPMCLWDYCAERRMRIHNVTPRDLFQLNGNTPTVATFGEQGDISNLCQFDWYDWCYFREESKHQFPSQRKCLGRVLGPIKNEGNEMCQAVLKANGIVVPRRTLRPLTISEINSESEKMLRKEFDESISAKLGSSTKLPKDPKSVDTLNEEDFKVEADGEEALLYDEDPVDSRGTAILKKPFHDYLIHAEVLLPQGEEVKSAKVKGRAKDANGKPVGNFNSNPLLNSIVYDVEFPDGAVKQYAANVIAENMYSQMDSEGYSSLLLDSILDWKRDEDAVRMEDKYIVTKTGTRRVRQTTRGWRLKILWKDGSESWVPLKLLKETHPVDVAEFAKAAGIDNEPAFCWWVPYTLRKRDRIISAINSRVRKTTHKYGIEVPTSIEHAREIDMKNGNTFWGDAVDKEMKNVVVAFEILEEDQPVPIGWVQSSGHLVFDVKMDFTRKARWVKDGHRTPDPEASTFAGVVSRDSVRVALTYAALNGIDVQAADIKNAYLQAPSSEKHFIICGMEFGIEHYGKRALIRRALYGGKSSGSDFWKHLRTCMEHLGFKSCLADPDIWMREAQHKDGSPYWEYVLLYVDDALCISNNAENVILNEIGKYFYVKDGSVGPPKVYLGNKVSKVTLDNQVEAWSFSSSQYVQAAVTNVESYLKEKGQVLPKKALAPFVANYRPELDVSPELNDTDASYYQSLIGILRWIVELGRADICVEASMMASHMAMPRKGHLEQLFHIFGYLKNNHNSELVLDPTEPEVCENEFKREDWGHTVFGDTKEELPHNAPQPRGFGFKIRAYVDADHAGDSTTRRSRTGFLVFLNSAPVYWTSKKQTSIETSSFGSEFIAMKNCCEYIKGLRYKLRMMGIPCEGPAYVYGDNKSVLTNSSIPNSVLKKKSSHIAYSFVREGTAKDIWRVSYINTHENPADLLSKPLTNKEKRKKHISTFLHHINGD